MHIESVAHGQIVFGLPAGSLKIALVLSRWRARWGVRKRSTIGSNQLALAIYNERLEKVYLTSILEFFEEERCLTSLTVLLGFQWVGLRR